MTSLATEFRDELIADGLLVPTAADGLYLRSERFERVVRGIDGLVSAAGADEGATALHLPLVVPVEVLIKTDYLRSFPNLAGVISTFDGRDVDHVALLGALDHGEGPDGHLGVSELALCSAACHPVYPTISSPIPVDGTRYDVLGTCFRHEPSLDPARMQVFRQHEFVYVGTEAGAKAHQQRWIDRALELTSSLGLAVEAVVANDPFFGRTGALLAANQRADALKLEIVSPIALSEPTAIASVNRHLDHFGVAFGLTLDDGTVASSACVGFGLERITLALYRTHGLDELAWPLSVRDLLDL
jgi:seryl-tRNA synthetase